MSINWNEVLDEVAKDPGFIALPKGRYPAVVKSAEAVTASTGAPMIKAQFSIQGGPYDTRSVITNIVFTKGNPKAMKFTLRKIAALGVTSEVLSAQNPSIDQIASMITGVECDIDIEVKKFDNEDTNDVAKIISRTAGTVSPPSISSDADAPPIPKVEAPSVPPAPVVPPAPTVADEPAAEPQGTYGDSFGKGDPGEEPF